MANPKAVLTKLAEIEDEMRRIAFWDESLDASTIRDQVVSIVSEQKRSPMEVMPFAHWLQAVFIPNARTAAETGRLPASSQVGMMAMREYDYHSQVPEAQKLLRHLNEFDALF